MLSTKDAKDAKDTVPNAESGLDVAGRWEVVLRDA